MPCHTENSFQLKCIYTHTCNNTVFPTYLFRPVRTTFQIFNFLIYRKFFILTSKKQHGLTQWINKRRNCGTIRVFWLLKWNKAQRIKQVDKSKNKSEWLKHTFNHSNTVLLKVWYRFWSVKLQTFNSLGGFAALKATLN